MTKLCVNFDTAPLAIGETILNGISPNGQIAVAHRRRIDILTANTGVYLNQDQAKALWKPRSRSIVEDAARNTSPGGYNLFDTQVALSDFPSPYIYTAHYPRK